MSFRSANNNTQEHIDVQIKVQVNKPDFQKKETAEIWSKAKDYAHERLWFGYILPGFLQANGVKTKGMTRSEMNEHIAGLWDAKAYEVNGQIFAVMDFSKEDYLLEGFDGEKPTRYDKEIQERVPVNINALATIGSNDFRWCVMQEWVPGDCFFGTYPVKSQGEIIKGKFKCVLKVKR